MLSATLSTIVLSEALRDLVRAREDTQEDIIRKRNQISKFLLRLEKRPPHGVKAWTIKYW